MSAVQQLVTAAANRGNRLPASVYRGKAFDWSIAFMDAEGGSVLVNKGGSYSARPVEAVESPMLSLTADAASWEQLASDKPAPGYQTLYTLALEGRLAFAGELRLFHQQIMNLEMMLGSLPMPEAAPVPARQAAVEPITGRYVNLVHDGQAYRIYFEEAGSGTPLICLHTAGSDGRQYRGLLNDSTVTEHFRVIVFDMPMHGKSSLSPGTFGGQYRLTTDDYVAFTMAFVEALALANPVVMGCSIGGRAVLHLALRHGDRFRAAIGLQSALYAHTEGDMTGESASELCRPDVNSPEVSAAAVAAITAPEGSQRERWETLWYYMQGGPGIFLGDLHYYFVDGDLRNHSLEALRDGACPLYLLTGEYDRSATPEMTAEVAEAVAAEHFEVMKDLGHFPMSENYAQFRHYLVPVLDKIRKRDQE